EQPRDFLGTLDFFVYFHDERWVEAFGRTILEAMASGVPVIIAEHFRGTFGDAALYTDPAGVRDLVLNLHADRAQYRAVGRPGGGVVVGPVRRRGPAGAHLRRAPVRPGVACVPARPAAVPPGAGAARRAQAAAGPPSDPAG